MRGGGIMDHKNTYLRFVNLMIAAERLSSLPPIDAVEARILKLLSIYWEQSAPITVVVAMKISDEVSSSTMFRYLKKLREKGYLQLVMDVRDNRVKYVEATNQTHRYFSELGKLMHQAVG